MRLQTDFEFDVFLNHSAKDEAVVAALAERLRADNLRVWFSAWEIASDDNISAKTEYGLEHSRGLVLCISAQTFASEWRELEINTLRFRDPLNKERRFIPLRLDETPVRGWLAPFVRLSWLPSEREGSYLKLLDMCAPPAQGLSLETSFPYERVPLRTIQLENKDVGLLDCVFSADRERALSSCDDNNMRLWDLKTGRCLRLFQGHTEMIASVAWSDDQKRALTGSNDKSIRLWDLRTGRCLRVLHGHEEGVMSVSWSRNQRSALSGSGDNSIRLWDLKTGRCMRVLHGHGHGVTSVSWSVDERWALSGSGDSSIRLWDMETGRCLRVFEGHTDNVMYLAWSADQRRALSASSDQTMRLWDIERGECLRVFEGHTSAVTSLAWSEDQGSALSGSLDKTVRLWDMATGSSMRVFEGHSDRINGIAWSVDQTRAFSGDREGAICEWNLSEALAEAHTLESPARALLPGADRVQYQNAKVILVGDSGVGKTGLAKVLVGEAWELSDSTVGAWATQWKFSRVRRSIP